MVRTGEQDQRGVGRQRQPADDELQRLGHHGHEDRAEDAAEDAAHAADDDRGEEEDRQR
jgi:hypothetical protein